MTTIVALVGRLGSGKSTAAEFLSSLGFFRVGLGNICRDEAAARGLKKPTRKDLQDIGDDLRQKHGINAIAERAWQKIQKAKAPLAVIEGPRNPADMNFVKEKADKFLCLALIADQKERYLRVVGRGLEQDSKAWEEFLEGDKRDGADPDNQKGQQTEAVIALADYRIDANKGKKEVSDQIKQILAKEGII